MTRAWGIAAPWGIARLGHVDDREEPRRAGVQHRRREQGQRVQVGLVAEQAPVQAWGGAVERARAELGHGLTCGDVVTLADGRVDRFVRGA